MFLKSAKWLRIFATTISICTAAELASAECRGRCQAKGFSLGLVIESKCYCADEEQTKKKVKLAPIETGSDDKTIEGYRY